MPVIFRLIRSIHSEQQSFHPSHLVLFGEQEARVDGSEAPIYHEGIVTVEEAGDLGKPLWIVLDW